ncbi:hypothetical protein HaLaN_04262 [Haematococcus lacustris]|uniref:Uncharacterized protein n=1 Tax=Haematococcus lacustris TaxID=44745 RepID=A0A699YIV0_HAELA|nr:hypothetical protein HaLaN_04262 [Haematococcus lacustris]
MTLMLRQLMKNGRKQEDYAVASGRALKEERSLLGACPCYPPTPQLMMTAATGSALPVGTEEGVRCKRFLGRDKGVNGQSVLEHHPGLTCLLGKQEDHAVAAGRALKEERSLGACPCYPPTPQLMMTAATSSA